MNTAQQHKSRLRDYFDGIGFERWSAIYGQAEVSRIRQTIRDGHALMLAQAEQWLVEGLETGDGRLAGRESRPSPQSPVPSLTFSMLAAAPGYSRWRWRGAAST